MRHLLKTAAIASSLVAASLVVGAGAAHAATQVVNFQGTVAPSCTFGAPTVGTLGNNPGGNYLGTDPLSGAGGANAQVDLNCTGAATITVSDITNNGSAPNILPGTTRASVVSTSVGTASLTNGVTNVPVVTPGALNETIEVGMYIITAGAVPNGTYNYNVTVTANPN